MKNDIARNGLAVVFAAALVVGLAAPAHADNQACSMARAAGEWSFTDNGTVIGIGPRTAVGIFTLDMAGNVLNAKATSSLNGTVAEETFSGNYTVNSDCTGSFRVKIFASGTEILDVTLDVAFDTGMKEIRGIFTSVATPNGIALPAVINLEGRRQ